MRNFFSSLFLVIASIAYANGQITITKAAFPKAGDTLRTVSDGNPKNLVMTESGGNQVWDFSTLKQSKTITKTAILDAKEGTAADKFPDATLIERGALGNENYIKITNKEYEDLGYAGADPTGFGLSVIARYDPTVTMRRAAKFFDIANDESALKISLPLAILPDSIKKAILGQFSSVDSLRIRFNSNRTDVVEGWGKLKIPGGEYDVLREKRINYSDSHLDLHLFGTWLDVTQFIGAAGGATGGAAGLLGKDTTITYNFFSDKAIEPIAVVTVDNK
ncbi:MAG: hypothetical protein RLZZ292_2154, partial [Bacteroidota bacterium]